MKILNLDPDFKPIPGEEIEFTAFTFPSGCEEHIKLNHIEQEEEVVITTRIKTSRDIMRLLLATDALKKRVTQKIVLVMPYLPYARQDRRMVSGEPLSIKVFADILNAQNYDIVMVFDAHSDVSAALINNIKLVNNHKLVYRVMNVNGHGLIVCPDAGAYKKVFALCQAIEYKEEIVICHKVRDVATGQIIETKVPDVDYSGQDMYIVDDICDGGGTFVLLAEALRKKNVGKINLIVSHGIFSKGIDALASIDRIYTTNSFPQINHSKLVTIDLHDGLLS